MFYNGIVYEKCVISETNFSDLSIVLKVSIFILLTIRRIFYIRCYVFCDYNDSLMSRKIFIDFLKVASLTFGLCSFSG